MPYIKREARARVINTLQPRTPGELNFLFSSMAAGYVRAHGLSYTTINDVIGAIEGAKQEFYRRVAAPYEDAKIEENGDVF